MALLLPAGIARANPDIVTLYDARSMAMAGTGQATVDGPAAVFHNPANMERMGRFGFSLSVDPIFMGLKSPVATPYQQEDGTLQVVPGFLLSVAGRVHDRVTIGGAAYLRSGFGGLYEDVTTYDPIAMLPLDRGDQQVAVGFIEMSVPVSVRVMDNLHVGVAVRWLYMTEKLDLVIPAAGQPPSAMDPRIDLEMNGFSRVPGFDVGVHYEPMDDLRFGITYQSRINVDLAGDLAVRPAVGDIVYAETSAESDFSVPHVLLMGFGYTYEDLTVAGDFAVRFWDQAVNEQVLDVPPMSLPMDPAPIPFNWKNSYEGRVGAEYRFLDGDLGLRLGYFIGSSATPEGTTDAFSPPPGILHMVSGGVGMQIEDFSVDLGGFYFILGADVDNSIKGPPGRYDGNVGGMGLSLSYDLE